MRIEALVKNWAHVAQYQVALTKTSQLNLKTTLAPLLAVCHNVMWCLQFSSVKQWQMYGGSLSHVDYMNG